MLSEGAIKWLAHGKRGLSSNTIFTHLSGIYARADKDHPHDSSDFGLCVLLLEAVPEWRSKMWTMERVSKAWAVLAPEWRKLEALYKQENPDWLFSYGNAPKTTQAITDLLGTVKHE